MIRKIQIIIVLLAFISRYVYKRFITERFPYKEEVTGSNPVAPTRVFQKPLHLFSKKTHKRHTKDEHFFYN